MVDSNKVIYCDASNPSNRILFYESDTHEDIRNKFVWERKLSKNKTLLREPEYILLKDLTNEHLERLCYFTLKGWHPFVNKCMVDEWNYRIDNNIVIK